MCRSLRHPYRRRVTCGGGSDRGGGESCFGGGRGGSEDRGCCCGGGGFEDSDGKFGISKDSTGSEYTQVIWTTIDFWDAEFSNTYAPEAHDIRSSGASACDGIRQASFSRSPPNTRTTVPTSGIPSTSSTHSWKATR